MDVSVSGQGEDQITLLLRALAEQTDDYAIILMDPEGTVIWWSPGAEQIFGVPRAEAVGRHSSFIFTAEDVRRGIVDLEMTIAGADGRSADDRWHVRADGSRFWSSGVMTALRNEARELIGFAKLLRNRTQLKEQLEQLREEVRVTREAEEGRKVGVATFAHELRNVLAAFTHGLNLLQTQGAAAQRREQLLDLMRDHIALMQRLSEDLLDIARIGAGKLQLRLEPLVLQDALRRAVNQVEKDLQAKGIELLLLTPPAPVELVADVERLQQAFGNLLDNAIKYTPEGGRIWVKATIEDREAVIYIEDSGIGIPPGMLARIFDLFTQVDAAHAQHGLGIGLALVKNLVALHGGSVQARSDGEGRGSEFAVRLPLNGLE